MAHVGTLASAYGQIISTAERGKLWFNATNKRSPGAAPPTGQFSTSRMWIEGHYMIVGVQGASNNLTPSVVALGGTLPGHSEVGDADQSLLAALASLVSVFNATDPSAPGDAPDGFDRTVAWVNGNDAVAEALDAKDSLLAALPQIATPGQNTAITVVIQAPGTTATAGGGRKRSALATPKFSGKREDWSDFRRQLEAGLKADWEIDGEKAALEARIMTSFTGENLNAVINYLEVHPLRTATSATDIIAVVESFLDDMAGQMGEDARLTRIRYASEFDGCFQRSRGGHTRQFAEFLADFINKARRAGVITTAPTPASRNPLLVQQLKRRVRPELKERVESGMLMMGADPDEWVAFVTACDRIDHLVASPPPKLKVVRASPFAQIPSPAKIVHEAARNVPDEFKGKLAGNPELRAHIIANNRCLICRRSNHFARDCPDATPAFGIVGPRREPEVGAQNRARQPTPPAQQEPRAQAQAGEPRPRRRPNPNPGNQPRVVRQAAPAQVTEEVVEEWEDVDEQHEA